MKNVFVLNIDNYRPDLCEYTLPTIRFWADKIGAKFNLITERQFPLWPITYEKLQVHTLGLGADWNILVDADFLLHPDLPDFTSFLNPSVVGIHYGFDLRTMFKSNPVFELAEHNQAIAAGFVITSKLTHDLWKPLEMPIQDALAQTKREFIIDEYALTYNLCKNGYQFTGVEFHPTIAKQMVHIGSEEKTPKQREDDLIFAQKTCQAWGI